MGKQISLRFFGACTREECFLSLLTVQFQKIGKMASCATGILSLNSGNNSVSLYSTISLYETCGNIFPNLGKYLKIFAHRAVCIRVKHNVIKAFSGLCNS